ncbi:MAG: hypothetical protein S4CHLAM102_00030 [Chlamydiia bacterium]|nr:hypothetical protein [Chlamydiia bacterium]
MNFMLGLLSQGAATDPHQLKDILTTYGLIIVLIILLLGATAAHFAFAFLHKKILEKIDRTQSVWQEALLVAIKEPLQVFIWFYTATLTFSVFTPFVTHSFIITAVSIVEELGFVLLFIWFLVRFVSSLEGKLLSSYGMKKYHTDETIVKMVLKILRAALFVVGSLVVMQTVGVPISGLIAFGGVGTVAIGFAAKDILANFFGGLVIFFDRPFNLGDRIDIPEKNIDGYVEHIGWRMTRVRLLDTKPAFIPNATFSTTIIENHTKRPHRRIDTLISLRYKDAGKIDEITKEAEEMIRNHPDVDQNKVSFVRVKELADSGIDLWVIAYTKKVTVNAFFEFQQDVLLKINQIIISHGADIAFPSRSLYMDREDVLVEQN